MAHFSQQILRYYRQLQPPRQLPTGFEVLYPQKEKEVMRVMRSFYRHYYSDDRKRILLLGINPGRFGAGATGINFTAPRQLALHCGIEHSLGDQSELSAEFIYEMIRACGGPDVFFHSYFLGAVSPFGYVSKGVNCNYYDSSVLLKKVEPFIVQSMQKLLRCNVHRSVCICIGEGKNLEWLEKWNGTHGWFSRVISVAHPRYIMQYKRRQKDRYVGEYLEALRKADEMVNDQSDLP
jgi:hypothetical protein